MPRWCAQLDKPLASPAASLIRPLVATLDACVLYPQYLRDFLLSTAYYGRLYAPCWSAAILQEVATNLVEDAAVTPARASRIVTFMNDAFPAAEVPVPETLLPCLTNQAKDRHVVAATIFTRAEVIVTVNTRDFRDRDLAPIGLVAEDPDTFLVRLYGGRADVLRQVLQRQMSHYTAVPIRQMELVARLALRLPKTMALVGTSPH